MKQWFEQHWLKGLHARATGMDLAEIPATPWIEMVRGDLLPRGNGRDGKPLKLGDVVYHRGLACAAHTTLVVHLPAAGRTFTAVVGVDALESRPEGKGKMAFSVRVGTEARFSSGTMNEQSSPQPVRVELHGATEFSLTVLNQEGYGNRDYADWADAKVTLEDGREMWLGEMTLQDRRSLPRMVTERTTLLPFSFVYDGQSSDVLLTRWTHAEKTQRLDASRTQHEQTWTDPKTGLQVRAVAVTYADYPAAEWTVYFKNTGAKDTPVLEKIQALETQWERSTGGEFLLRSAFGDFNNPEAYQPIKMPLPPAAIRTVCPEGGRPSNKYFPYFNLQRPGGGVFVAVGWPGQWAASFARDDDRGLRVTAGQELFHASLRPGEEVRTPLIALLFWEGEDPVAAQNLWRRWMIAHNLPRPGGKLPEPMAIVCAEGIDSFYNTAEDMRRAVEVYEKAGIKVDYWWRDAGWYPSGDNQWWNTGTWEFDPARFPGGLKPFSDHVHARGMKLITWFEPERVGPAPSWLREHHPEWLLGEGLNLVNLGNPEAWKWVLEHFDKLLTDNGIDLYRQDFNMEPLDCWRRNDAPDRQGMTENLYVQGYLAYWDELRRRHPDMPIDSCASGGRRNDLETLRRAVPLLRSDYQVKPEATVGNQGHTYGISSWFPFTGSGCGAYDLYTVRSYYQPSFGCGNDMSKPENLALVQRAYREFKQVAACMYGDYYPLTPYSLDEGAWIAWQFHVPEEGKGAVQAFRRSKNDVARQTLRLRGLDPKAKYEVTSLDGAPTQTRSGKELMEQGLTVEIEDKPGSAIYVYEKRS